MSRKPSIGIPHAILALSLIIYCVVLAFPGGMPTAVADTGWTAQVPGTSSFLMAVSAADAQTAWAVGMGGAIVKTTDGETWSAQTSGTTAQLQSVDAVDTMNAWVVGTNGTILRTIDGGATWVSRYAPTSSLNLYDVAAVSANIAWVTGLYGDPATSTTNRVIAKTTDGGKTWVVQHFQAVSFNYYNPSICSISAINSDTAVAYGQYAILQTTDGGNNWISQPCSLNLLRISAVNTSVAWATTNNNFASFSVVRSTDGGSSWDTRLEVQGGAAPLAISPISNDAAWAAGANGGIFRTDDAGNTWFLQNYTSGLAFSGVSAFDTKTAWVVGVTGQSGTILRTTDGGGAGQPVPCLRSLSPKAGPVGSEITITGTGFGSVQGSAYVAFNGTASTGYTLWSNTEIKCKVPSIPLGAASVDIHSPNATTGRLPFNVTASGPPNVTSINPATGVNNANYAAEILGSGFQSGATVGLVQGATVIDGVGVTFTSSGRLTCYFDLTSKPLGKYDVVVKNPDNQESRLNKGFSVTDICGQGAGASISVFVGLIGLMSLAGAGMRRRRSRSH